MRFLSVAEMELRAGARQKATHRIRWITPLVFCALLAWLMWAFNGFRAPQIFHAYSILIFLYCLILGTARTADCLSSEKREGTLGLLFLTNLNGPEIIGGKWCSNALGAAYGLFAIFPLLALQMLIGGLTFAQFWKTFLALADAVFFAVAAGFLASSLCVRQFTAVAIATGLAFFFSLGLMGLATVARALLGSKGWIDGFLVFSPLNTLITAQQIGRNNFWWSNLAVSGLSWIWLGLATWRTSWGWRDRPTGTRGQLKFKPFEWLRRFGTSGRATLRRRLLTINPFYWLAGRGVVSAPVFMLITILVTVCTSYIAAPYFGRVMKAGTFSPVLGHLFSWIWAGLAIHALVLYYAAMIASRRLAEDKQTGALELVLSTPTTERSISRGLWMAYGRRMLFPACVAILTHSWAIWLGASLALLDPSSTHIPPGITAGELIWRVLWNLPVGGARMEWGFVFGLRMLLLMLVLFILAWITLGWVARWLGLKMKHPGFAPMVSLGLLLIPPIILFSFACYVADKIELNQLPGRIFVSLMMWVAFGIGAGHFGLLSLWASGRLRKRFRAVVTSRFQPPPTRRWWLPTRRGVVRFGLAGVSTAAALVMIVVSFYGYQNWRSRRTWSAFQKELKQRGQSLDVAVLATASVPSDQNFARTAAFQDWVHASQGKPPKNLLSDKLKQFDTQAGSGPGVGTGLGTGFEWVRGSFAPLNTYSSWFKQKSKLPKHASRADYAYAVLDGLESQEAALRSLSDAARLPYFQASTNCAPWAFLQNRSVESSALERLHMLLQVRACALLATNRSADAAEDVLSGLRMASLARQIPDSLSSTRVQTMLVHSFQPLWEGLIEHRWTEPQLASIQTELEKFNLLPDFTNAVQRVVLAQMQEWRWIAEQKKTSPYHDDIRQWQPRAWWYDNCIQLYQAGQNAIGKVDVAAERVRIEMNWMDLEGLPLNNGIDTFLRQYYWTGASPDLVVFAQTAVNQAILACALERHRLARGQYPETLESLMPEYLRAIPKDAVRGLPMIYENDGNGKFTLRSVGPNQTNDRGKPVSDDWLWSFPTNAVAKKVQ